MTTYLTNCKIFSKFSSVRTVESCISPEKWHSWNSSKGLLINKPVYSNKGQHILLKHSAYVPFINTQTPTCGNCILITQEDWLLIGSVILTTSVSISPVGTRNPVALSNTSVARKQSPGQMFSCIFFLTTRSISIQIFIRKNLYILLSKEVEDYVLLQYFKNKSWLRILFELLLFYYYSCLYLQEFWMSSCLWSPAFLSPSTVTHRSLPLKCFLFKGWKKDGWRNLSCGLSEICTVRVLRVKAEKHQKPCSEPF